MCPANLCVDATKVTWHELNLFCFSGVFQPVYAERENNPFAFILRRIFRGAGVGPVHLAGRIRPRSERLQTQIGPGPRRHQRQPAPVLPHREETTAQRRYGRSLPIFSIYVRL